MPSTDTNLLISLPQDTVARLLGRRAFTEEALGDVVARLLETRQVESSTAAAVPPLGRYAVSVLGIEQQADTIADALCYALGNLSDMDDSFLGRLAALGGRTRKDVATDRSGIHSGRADLNAQHTRQFRPGWWVGTNYSFSDASRILRDACRVTGLKFGADIVLQRARDPHPMR